MILSRVLPILIIYYNLKYLKSRKQSGTELSSINYTTFSYNLVHPVRFKLSHLVLFSWKNIVNTPSQFSDMSGETNFFNSTVQLPQPLLLSSSTLAHMELG